MKGDPNLGRVFTRKCCSRGCSGGVGSGSDGLEEGTGVGEAGKSGGGAAGLGSCTAAAQGGSEAARVLPAGRAGSAALGTPVEPRLQHYMCPVH